MNRLYFGDCLAVMRDHMKLGSVDLIYLDPPFKSNRDYNTIYKDETGRPLPDQINAFCDMWVLNEERERALRAMPILMREAGIEDATVEFWRLWMNALRGTQPELLAYLSYMVERLVLMKGILKPTGTIYLHCDPTASHYIKVMMDGIFGHDKSISEVIWNRAHVKGDSKRKFAANHDVLLVYANGRSYTFNPVYGEQGKEYRSRFNKNDDDGRGPYRLAPLDSPNPRPNLTYMYKGYPPPENGWRVSLEVMKELDRDGRLAFPKVPHGRIARKHYLREQKGPMISDVWMDIGPLQSGGERLGYATQKPVALLERIITVSSNPGDMVFDPFCGCATTLEAAHRLNRRWIGIDIAIHAIKKVAKARLQKRLRLVEGEHFTIEGVPQNLEGAHDLWSRDKYHFQKWAVEQVDGFVTTKRSADGGVDGRIYFAMPENDARQRRPLESMAIEVKGGKNVGINVVRELRGVLDNDHALMASLIVLEPLGERKEQNFRKFMANGGDLDVLGMKYARMQMLTVAEILEGKRFHTPGAVGRVDQAALPLS